MNTQLIALLSAATAAGIALLAQEALKEMIKKSMSDVTPQRVRRILTLIIIGIGIAFYFGGLTLGNAITPEEPEPVIVETPAKTKEEVIVDAISEGIDQTQEFLENKREKDSTFLADREKFYVYRIGVSIDDESDAWDVAQEVNALGNISIFKEARKSYVIICDPAWDKAKLEDSLQSYENKLASMNLTYRIEIADLMESCSKKEHIIQTSDIEKKKQDQVFKCLTCDK